ncbi:uncharacterized protein PAC_08302 [Phialocephala subalpina]|uniref:Myb-like domain-containing protein n=1 Tax=Phialocephala subalpina TaxID=576137 RepID=A0A1L7X065_9HELO|nr:uncharacterized protein PAC_08302 [Phialocephala subalpina]
MNNTIEPRLIALLNQELYGASPSLELPPLHDPNILKASGRPLLLEPDASKRNGKPTANPQLASKHSSLLNPLDDDEKAHQGKRSVDGGERALGVSSPQSLRKILDDDTEPTVPVSGKKRHVAEPSKDDFVQLPQPPKKQKTAKQVVPPIIIGLFEPPPQATLFPPIASSSFHDSHGRNSLNTVPPKVKVAKETENPGLDSTNNTEKDEPQEKKSKKRKPAPGRKKWTDEETDTLLLGVAKHGIGCWTDIIKDPSFSFNNRSALDLKDRFRTCCPDELRGGTKGKAKITTQRSTSSSKTNTAKSRSSLMSENILRDEEDYMDYSLPHGNSASAKGEKSRAHRKKMEDLAQLGIVAEVPFRQSDRRERRSFTVEEDDAILEGFNMYGFAWSRIQREPKLNLQNRQPTDLRDRFRNKFPDKFKKVAEAKKKPSAPARLTSGPQQFNPKGKDNSVLCGPSFTSLLQGQENEGPLFDVPGKENLMASTQQPLLQSSSNREGLRIQEIISSEQELSKALPLQQSNPLFGFKDNFVNFGDQPSMDSSDSLPYSQSFDWNSNIAAPFYGNSGEMDISRLLLDETWPEIPSSSGKEKQSFTDLNSITNTSSAEPVHNVPSFLNLLNDVEDINDGPFG